MKGPETNDPGSDPGAGRRPGIYLCAALGFVAIGLLVSSVGRCDSLDAAAAEEASPGAGDVEMLRLWGNLEGAAQVARDWLARLEADPDSPEWQKGDARREIAVLEHVLSGPKEWREALTEADRKVVAFFQAWEADDAAGCLEATQNEIEIRTRLLGADHWEVARSHNFMALALEPNDRLSEARDHYRTSLRIQQAQLEPGHPSLAYALSNLAENLDRVGRFGEAEILYRRAIAIERVHQLEPGALATTLNNLGDNLYQQGDLADAERYFREALERRTEELEQGSLAMIQSRVNLASVLVWQRERRPEAEKLLTEALDLCLGRDEACPLLAHLHQLLAMVRYDQADLAGAEKHILAAVETRREAGSMPTVNMMVNHATILTARKKYAEAETRFEEALELWQAAGGKLPDRIWFLRNFANLRVLQDRAEEAIALLERAGIVYDGIRWRVTRKRRPSFQTSPYRRLAAVRAGLGQSAEAWDASERYFARTLLDSLRVNDARSLTAEERQREQALVDEFNLAESAWPRDEVRLESAEADYLEFRSALEATSGINEGQPAAVGRVQATLKPDEAVIGWIIDYEEDPIDSAWGFVLRKTGPVAWVRLDLGLGEHDSRFAGDVLNATVRDRRLKPLDTTSVWKTRLAPLMDHLDGVTRLIVVPSGDMLGVPLDAVSDAGGRALGQRFAISYTPSATVLAWLREKSPGRRWDEQNRPRTLAVADPPFNQKQLAQMMTEAGKTPPDSTTDTRLGGPTENRLDLGKLRRVKQTREEVEVLRGLGSPESRTLVGPDASERNLHELATKGELGRYDLLHFATHAIVASSRIGGSQLILSQIDTLDAYDVLIAPERVFDGVVTEKEVYREWQLDADLVTLSGCETAVGEPAAGEGYLGLGHAFLQSGARTVLVSLWPVEQGATSLLMQRFYGNLLGPDSRTKTDALREAKAWVRDWPHDDPDRPKSYAHPYFWAGFVLIGDSG